MTRPPPTPDREGLRVILKRMPGYTPKDLLQQFFYFQVPPMENFKHSHGHGQQTYETLRGEFSRPAGRKLIQIQFTTMVIDWMPEWSLLHAEGWEPNPIDISRNLIALSERGYPFLFTAGQPALWGRYDILDLPMTLPTIDVDERAGEVDARYLDVTFQEFRSPQMVTSKGKGKARKADNLPSYVEIATTGAGRDRNGHRFPRPTLHSLSLHFYGTVGRWTVIAKKNGMRDYAPTRSLEDWAKRHQGRDRLQIPRLPTGDDA
jgi:hypothetical protein